MEYAPKLQFRDADATAPDDRGLDVAVLTAPGMYLPDVVGAIETLGALPNATFRHVWKTRDEGKGMLGPTVVPDTTFDDCPQADVLVLGANLPRMHSDPEVLGFIRRQAPNAKAIICVCAGSLLIGAAGLLDGHTATSNFHMTHMLRRCGATPAHEDLVSSGKFYSAGPAIGSYEAALLAIGEIYGEGAAAYIERQSLEYSPAPVFGVGSPELAGAFLTVLSRAAFAPGLPLFSWNIRRGYRASRQQPLTPPGSPLPGSTPSGTGSPG